MTRLKSSSSGFALSAEVSRANKQHCTRRQAACGPDLCCNFQPPSPGRQAPACQRKQCQQRMRKGTTRCRPINWGATRVGTAQGCLGRQERGWHLCGARKGVQNSIRDLARSFQPHRPAVVLWAVIRHLGRYAPTAAAALLRVVRNHSFILVCVPDFPGWCAELGTSPMTLC